MGKKTEVRSGPFTKSDIENFKNSQLAKSILVQEVELWHPFLRQLQNTFSFLPNWRLDDVMISYAGKNGSVGAHLDEYDVILIQAQGARRWLYEASARAPKNDEFLKNRDLKILKHFDPNFNKLCVSGDALYLPARVPHHGIGEFLEGEDCLTISIGFRSPSVMEIFTHYIQEVMESNSNSNSQDNIWDKLRPKDQFIQSWSTAKKSKQFMMEKNSVMKFKNFLQATLFGDDNDNIVIKTMGQLLTTPKRKDSLTFNFPVKKITYPSLSGVSYFLILSELVASCEIMLIKNEKTLNLFVRGAHFQFEFNKKSMGFWEKICQRQKVKITENHFNQSEIFQIHFLIKKLILKKS